MNNGSSVWWKVTIVNIFKRGAGSRCVSPVYLALMTRMADPKTVIRDTSCFMWKRDGPDIEVESCTEGWEGCPMRFITGCMWPVCCRHVAARQLWWSIVCASTVISRQMFGIFVSVRDAFSDSCSFQYFIVIGWRSYCSRSNWLFRVKMKLHVGIHLKSEWACSVKIVAYRNIYCWVQVGSVENNGNKRWKHCLTSASNVCGRWHVFWCQVRLFSLPRKLSIMKLEAFSISTIRRLVSSNFADSFVDSDVVGLRALFEVTGQTDSTVLISPSCSITSILGTHSISGENAVIRINIWNERFIIGLKKEKKKIEKAKLWV